MDIRNLLICGEYQTKDNEQQLGKIVHSGTHPLLSSCWVQSHQLGKPRVAGLVELEPILEIL